jgi:hypothetical protein
MVFGAAFAETLDNTGNPYEPRLATPTVERFVFRTGAWRMKDFGRYDTDEDNGAYLILMGRLMKRSLILIMLRLQRSTNSAKVVAIGVRVM